MKTGRIPAIITASLLGFALTAGGVAIAESASADTTTTHSVSAPLKHKKHKKVVKHHVVKHHAKKHHKVSKHHAKKTHHKGHGTTGASGATGGSGSTGTSTGGSGASGAASSNLTHGMLGS